MESLSRNTDPPADCLTTTVLHGTISLTICIASELVHMDDAAKLHCSLVLDVDLKGTLNFFFLSFLFSFLSSFLGENNSFILGFLP